MEARDPDSIHAIVTDPPYGLKEYTEREKTKLRAGRGGVWRIPPSFDGCPRAPLPRFTVLGEAEKKALQEFFREFARKALRVLVPGGHVFIDTNPLLSHLVYLALWRYLVDPTKSIKADRVVVIWRVDVAFLEKSDWKYEASTAGSGGGGRTHTFGLKRPAEKLRGRQVYALFGVRLRNGKPVLVGD